MDALNRLRLSIQGGNRKVILQAETGSGKTVMAVKALRGCREKGRRGLFIARGREIVKQTCRMLDTEGLPYGVIMAGQGTRPDELIQVASKDTFYSWCIRRGITPAPDSDLVISDECHGDLATVTRQILNRYPKAKVIGLTATPARANGAGLGDIYDDMVQAIPPSELIAQGWIVPTKVFAPFRPNLKGVKVQQGDYNLKQLSCKMDRPTLVGDIVKHWRELGQDRPTFVFTCNIAHCLHVRDQFNEQGIHFRHIDSRTTEEEEVQEVLGLFRDGKIRGIVSVGKLTQGVDIPLVSCGILARPTRSYILYRQMVGRLKRPHPGKTDCLLLDHAGAVYTHGMPDEDVEWSLDPGTKVSKDRIKPPPGEPPGEREPVCCAKCYCMYKGPQCPNCGHKPPHRKKKLQVAAGKLVEIFGDQGSFSWEDKVRYWHRCLGIAANKGRTFGAAAHIFYSKFGHWPERGLPNYPVLKEDWAQPVKAVCPQYVRA